MDSSTIGKAGVQRNKNVAPNPKSVGPASVAGVEKNEATGFAAVRGGAGATANTKHGGHGQGSGGPSFAAQKEARGHHDASGLFAAQKGRAPVRGPGMSSPKKGVEDWGAR
jgi:hypothetical protein